MVMHPNLLIITTDIAVGLVVEICTCEPLVDFQCDVISECTILVLVCFDMPQFANLVCIECLCGGYGHLRGFQYIK